MQRADPALFRIWLAVGALAGGTILGLSTRASWITGALLAAGAGLVILRRSALALAGMAAIVCAVGWLGASEQLESGDLLDHIASSAPHCRAAGSVLESAGSLGTIVTLRLLACEGHATIGNAGRVLLEDDIGEPGSRVATEGLLVRLGHGPFDSARRRLGVSTLLHSSAVALKPPSGLLGVASGARRGLGSAVAGIDPERGALLRGLTIGDTSDIDGATIEYFRRAGLSHLLAVSGSNVAIVLAAVGVSAHRLPLKLRIGCGLGALAFFVLVVGPEPSVLRAGVMGAIGLVALMRGRVAQPLHALGLALIAVIGARPWLVFSLGLQLSAAATAGIVLWTGPVARALRRLPRPLALSLAATLAAQLAVAPVLVGVFGQLSVAGVVANLVVVPAVAPATVLGLSAAVGEVASPTLGHLLARAAEPFSAWILEAGRWFGSRSWASVELSRAWAWAMAAPVAACALWALLADEGDDDIRAGSAAPPRPPG